MMDLCDNNLYAYCPSNDFRVGVDSAATRSPFDEVFNVAALLRRARSMEAMRRLRSSSSVLATGATCTAAGLDFGFDIGINTSPIWRLLSLSERHVYPNAQSNRACIFLLQNIFLFYAVSQSFSALVRINSTY